MTTYGFLGAGNMAGAIVEGLLASGVPTESIVAWSPHDSARALAGRTGVRTADDAESLVRACDVLVVAVKPHVVGPALAPLREVLAERSPLVVSLAAGLSTEQLESLLPDGARVVRAMPNMAAAVRESMTALAAGSRATGADMDLAADIMGRVGRTTVLTDREFPAFVALAGSSPAFVFAFVEALARGGVEAGLPKERATGIIVQALFGSALTLRREADLRADGGRGRTPADLVDAVSSPAGTTVAGLLAMERAGFSPAVVDGVRATVARDRELGA